MKRTSRLVGAVVLAITTIVSGPVEHALSATDLVTLEAESMSGPGTIRADATASGGRAVVLSGNGSLSAPVNSSSPITNVTVRAKGDQCLGAPALEVRIDGVAVKGFSVTATNWSNHSATTSVPAGEHTVTLAYTNDRTSSRCNRRLHLDVVTVFTATATATSTPTPTPTPTPTSTPTPTPTPTPSPAPTPTPSPAPTAAPTPPPGLSVAHLWTNSDTASAFDAVADSPRTDVFIAHAFDSWAQADAYHLNRPAGQAYFYANFGVAGDPCCVASVLDAATVDARGWWATHDGAKIPNPWGGTSWLVDLGKPGVVDAYVAALKAKWGAHDWQGIFADDVNAWRNLGYTIDGYTSVADWIDRAVVPLMRTVTTAIATDKAGVVIPNIGNWPQEPDLDAVADVSSGGLNEWFLTWGGGAGQGVREIENEYASMRRAIAAGHVYLGIVHSTTLTHYAFCAAAIMGERGRVLITNQTSYGSASMTWDPVFELDLGAPTEATRHTTGSTTWSRGFANRSLSIDTASQTCAMQ